MTESRGRQTKSNMNIWTRILSGKIGKLAFSMESMQLLTDG